MADKLEQARIELCRNEIEKKHGKAYDTRELQEAFTVHGFAAPIVSVTRKIDNQRGYLTFNANPRFYYNFKEC
jgi:hypothetical protein